MRLFVFFILIPAMSFGQMEIFYQENQIQSYDTIIYISTEKPIVATVFGEAITVKNASSVDKHIKVYREELEMIDGSESQICWGNFCYGPAVSSSIESLIVPSGEIEETFKAYYLPNDNFGQSDIKFRFVDTLSSEEIVVVTRFQVLDLTIPVFNIDDVSVYPNPFINQLTIDGLPIDKSYVITDYLGQLVYQGNDHSLELSFLRKGLYILNIENSRSIKIMKR